MMRLTLLALCSVLACIDHSNAAPEATCKEFVSTLTKKQLGGIATCAKSMKFKNPKDKAAKMNCILKCVLIAEQLLDADGQIVDEVNFQKFLDTLVPSNLMDLAGTKLTNCRTSAGGPFDKTDEFCKSYDPLIKCMLDVIGSLCKGLP